MVVAPGAPTAGPCLLVPSVPAGGRPLPVSGAPHRHEPRPGRLRFPASRLVPHQILRSLQPLAPEGMRIELFEGLGELPHFSEDLEADPPAPVRRLRQAIADADGLIIATPEYNGAIPGVLKNAFDWASRPAARASLTTTALLAAAAAFTIPAARRTRRLQTVGKPRHPAANR
ncbi:NADPH-dependent FMN reductase [Kitasatospora sp. NPDC101155]|uniref:NADPH-dependent FMN reductase n=1 Tax=Kitasatospora sp. NPDC101155 TaxID=3364097 RepID=UPI00382E9B61